MSAVALADVVTSSDILTRTNLKPWWETVRAYLWAGMFVTSLYMVYFIHPDDSFNCRPCSEDICVDSITQCKNVSVALTTRDIIYVNKVCVDESDVKYKLLGPLSVIASMVIYVSYLWWVMHPRVISGFYVARMADGRLSEYKKELPTKEAATDLWKGTDESPDINSLYLIRNGVSSVILLLVIGLGIWVVFSTDQTTICSHEFLSGMKVQYFACLYNIHNALLPYVVIYLCFAGFQLILIGIIIYCAVSNETCVQSSDNSSTTSALQQVNKKFRAKMCDNRLIELFSQHSQYFAVATRNLLTIKSEAVVKSMMLSREKSPRKDCDFVQLLYELKYDNPKPFVEELLNKTEMISTQTLGEGYSESMRNGPCNIPWIKEIIRISFVAGGYEPFIAAHHLLFGCLDNTKCFSLCKCGCDRFLYDLTHEDITKCSIMFYALSKPREVTPIVAEHILYWATRNSRGNDLLFDDKFVRQGENRKTMKEYVQQNYQDDGGIKTQLLSIINWYCRPRRPVPRPADSREKKIVEKSLENKAFQIYIDAHYLIYAAGRKEVPSVDDYSHCGCEGKQINAYDVDATGCSLLYYLFTKPTGRNFNHMVLRHILKLVAGSISEGDPVIKYKKGAGRRNEVPIEYVSRQYKDDHTQKFRLLALIDEYFSKNPPKQRINCPTPDQSNASFGWVKEVVPDALELKGFEMFVNLHHLIFSGAGNSLLGHTDWRYCDCDRQSNHLNLNTVDTQGNSLMFYVLSAPPGLEGPDIKVVRHVLYWAALKGPLADTGFVREKGQSPSTMLDFVTKSRYGKEMKATLKDAILAPPRQEEEPGEKDPMFAQSRV